MINSIEELLIILTLRWIRVDWIIQRLVQRSRDYEDLAVLATLRDLLDADAQEIQRLQHQLEQIRCLLQVDAEQPEAEELGI